MTSIILTGGKSTRFGKNKSEAIVCGKTLLEILVSNLPDNDIVIVGPETNVAARYIREEPLFSGPVAAIAAALKIIESDSVAVFATDMPFAPLVLPELLRNFNSDAAIPLDALGISQPLSAIYRTESLKRAISSLPTATNQSMKKLLEQMTVELISTCNFDYLMDIDSPEDIFAAISIQRRFTP